MSYQQKIAGATCWRALCSLSGEGQCAVHRHCAAHQSITQRWYITCIRRAVPDWWMGTPKLCETEPAKHRLHRLNLRCIIMPRPYGRGH